jgi:signal transduction histidine kinase
MGLFGNAAQQWGETIQIWSEDPSTYKVGDVYAERIELENRRVVAVTLSPVRLRSDFLGTVSIFRDITHEVEVERLKSEFVATVSHELRTPMTSIKGYVEIMLMGATGPLSEQQAHFLQVVKQNTERLAILVNDLLDVSRIEAGKVTLSMQALDLSEVVDEVLSTYAQRMKDEDRPMIFSRDVPPALPRVTGDRERVLQILDNLVENAYQYTPVNGHILVRLSQVGREVQIEVTDDGIGIPEEDQPRVFERFFRGEDPLVMATSGTGLGLQIVQTLVELHKGRIWFESSGVRGEGSTFYVTLPINEE